MAGDENKVDGIAAGAMSFVGHLAELRRRLMVAGGAFMAVSLAAFGFADRIADFLMAPAGNLQFVYLSPPDLFMSYVKLSLAVGFAVSSPVILLQVWAFVKPALKGREKSPVVFALAAGTFFFALGASFAYYVIVPFTIKFFLQYQSAKVMPMFSIADYFSFVSGLALSFGAAFELPVAASLLGAVGVLKSGLLVKARKMAVLGVFVAAAVLTPPDVVSQILLALPMLGLYELSVLILRRQEKSRAKAEAREAAREAARQTDGDAA